jgi:hypothetical protein
VVAADNKRVRIIEGKDEHVNGLIGKLRKADWDEVYAVTGENPDSNLPHAWELSKKYRWTAMIDGEVAALFGVAKMRGAHGVGVPWMLGTDKLFSVPKVMVKEARAYTKRWMEIFGLLTNFVDCRNTKSIKWLRRVGFKFDWQKVEYGALKLPFYRFYMERDNV